MTRWVVVVLAVLSLVGCSSDDDAPSKPKSALSFAADAAVKGPAVSLRAKSVSDTRVVLELVAQDLTALYGLAYRLEYDPAVLRFAEQQRGPGFGALSTLEAAKEPRPGLMLGAVSGKGAQKAVAASGVVLAEVSFDVVKVGATRVDFVAGRNGVLDAAGKATGAGFSGGALELR